MPAITLSHKAITLMEAQLYAAGADDSRWTLAADARIKTSNNPVGVGPLVYKGRPKDESGNYTSSGEVQDAIFLFFDDDGSGTQSLISGETEADVLLTIDAFLNAHGGDVPTMKGLKPTVG